MEGLLSISSIISFQDFMASLDLQDAFLTIAMHPDMFKYLCFDFEGTRYCFIALVFGLSCAPRIFSKLLKVPLSYLRIQGFKNSAWLDDILLVDSSFSHSSYSISHCRSLLESLGFIIKPSKSNLTPSQSITHVGFLWDSVSFSVKVLPEKVSSLKLLCSSAISGHVSIRFLAKIIGVIDSFKFGCPIAPLHYRSLQFDLIHNYPFSENWDAPITLSNSALDDIKWWLNCDLSLPPSSLASFSPTHQIETDASLKGWGAYSHSSSFTQGKWSTHESHFHINYLELLAVFLGIQSLFPGSSPISLLALCDNVSAVRYINRKGGTRSRKLCTLSLSLWDYCLSHNIQLRAVYHRGSDNVRADDLSRNFKDNHDYHLSAHWFRKLHARLDFCLEIDLFASRIHHHLPIYSSFLPDPGAKFIDAFSVHWPNSIYLFPPIILLDRVINKFITDNCRLGLLIAPYRPSSPVFSSILDLCISPPIILPETAVIREPHHCRTSQMWAWTISCDPSLRRVFLRTLSPDSSETSGKAQSINTNATGPNFTAGVSKGKSIKAILL